MFAGKRFADKTFNLLAFEIKGSASRTPSPPAGGAGWPELKKALLN